MNAIQIKDILPRLLPWYGEGIMILWGLTLFFYILMCMLCLFRQVTPNTNVLLFLSVVILFAFLDRIGVGWTPANTNFFSSNPCSRNGVLLFPMRVAMIVFPLLAISVSKSPKSRPFGIIAASTGAIYFILRGILDWKLLTGPGIVCDF